MGRVKAGMMMMMMTKAVSSRKHDLLELLFYSNDECLATLPLAATKKQTMLNTNNTKQTLGKLPANLQVHLER